MNIVDLSIKKPVLISMVLIALVFFGAVAYFKLPVSLIPMVKTPTVSVQVIYPGASPDVIETQITKPIEDAGSAVSGIKEIQSFSMDGLSYVIFSFEYYVQENIALQDIKDKVDTVIFPATAKKPKITKMNAATEISIMDVVVEGDLPPAELYDYTTKTIKNRFSQISGVGSVDVVGGAERQIHINFDRNTIYERELDLKELADRIATGNIELPAGNYDFESRDIPIQFKGKYTSLSQIENLDISTSTGTFKLHQLADVKDTTKKVRERTIIMDKKAGARNANAILLQVKKNPTGNTIHICEEIEKLIPQIEAEKNGHIKFNVVSEDRPFVQACVDDTLSNVIMGIVLTAIVLFLFLHDLRSTLIIALAMPFSIIATFLVMQFMNISLNLFSLTGISGATGTLVANSVVVLENIFKYKAMGKDKIESTSVGTKEVILAVFASTLTNIAVFLPLAMIKSAVGDLFGNFALSTVISTIFSIVVSFTLTPLMAARILPEKIKEPDKLGKIIEGWLNKLSDSYGRSLKVIMKNKRNARICILASVAILILSLTQAGNMGFEFLPTTDGGKLQMDVELSQGNDLKRTGEILEMMEKRLAAHDEVVKVETILGKLDDTNKNVSNARVMIYLGPKKDRLSSIKLAPKYSEELADVPGAKITISPISEINVGGQGAPLDLFVRGENMDNLQMYADQVLEQIASVPGFTNAALSSKPGKQELDFFPDRLQIEYDGITVQDVALTLQAAIDGAVTTKYKDGSEEYEILVTIDDGTLLDMQEIENIPIKTPHGMYPLYRYALDDYKNSTSKIMRKDKVKTIEVTAFTLPGYSIGKLESALMAKIDSNIKLDNGYTIVPGGSTKTMNETIRDLAIALFTAILITYMVLAGSLESLSQPILILATLPLTVIGVVFAVVGTRAVINMVAMLGIIQLVGVVVNNAILILDIYNQMRREKHLGMQEAMVEACSSKLKAILMSNIAIVLGQLPMALGIGDAGAEMRQPMGIVMVGGIVSSTVLTIYVIPALQLLITKKSELIEEPSEKFDISKLNLKKLDLTKLKFRKSKKDEDDEKDEQ